MREPRLQRDRADQHGHDRQVAPHRNAVDRRQRHERGAECEQRQPGPGLAERLVRVLFGAGLHRQRRRGPRGIARRHPAAADRGAEAEQEEERDGVRGVLQFGSSAAEEAAAQVAAEHVEGQARDGGPEQQAERAAGHAEDRRLDHQQPLQLAGRDSRHPQERQLRAARDRRLRLQREHEEAAGEQRHQRQHVQVDAIGARQVRHPCRFRVGARDRHAGRQLQRPRQAVDRRSRGELHVDARQLAEPVEPPLRVTEVHHADHLPCARAGQGADDRQPRFARPGEHAQLAAHADLEPLERGGRQEDTVAEDRETRRVVPRHRHQRLRQGSGAEDVETDDRQHGRARLVDDEHRHVELQHGAGQFDGRMRDDAREQVFVEAVARRGDRRVGLSRDGAHRGRELAQRRGVDQVHRVAERDAHGDGQDLHQRPQAMLPRVAGEDVPGEPPHEGSLAGRLVWNIQVRNSQLWFGTSGASLTSYVRNRAARPGGLVLCCWNEDRFRAWAAFPTLANSAAKRT